VIRREDKVEGEDKRGYIMQRKDQVEVPVKHKVDDEEEFEETTKTLVKDDKHDTPPSPPVVTDKYASQRTTPRINTTFRETDFSPISRPRLGKATVNDGIAERELSPLLQQLAAKFSSPKRVGTSNWEKELKQRKERRALTSRTGEGKSRSTAL
jgi:hypothetical protein